MRHQARLKEKEYEQTKDREMKEHFARQNAAEQLKTQNRRTWAQEVMTDNKFVN